MDAVTTENPYPVQGIWLLKNILSALVYVAIVIVAVIVGSFIFKGTAILIGGAYLFLLLLIVPFQVIIPLIVNALRRHNFHYTIGDAFMTFHQGILSKQQRNVPYGVIQGVFLHQDLFDRLLGLASLSIEDASQGGKSRANIDGDVLIGGKHKSKVEIIGFMGNKIHIPGLKKENAEALKVVVLQKMKENPIEDSQSGL